MEILNKPEAAKFLRCSMGWVDRAMRRGDLAFVKMGGKVFFRRESLESFVKSCERKAQRCAAEEINAA
jgi:excisionase family DNA binding protein